MERTENSQRRIIIDHFGALQNIDVSINEQLFITIGPQASGKSTLAKIVYFCRKIRDYLCDYANEIWNKKIQKELFINFTKCLTRFFIGYFGTTKHMDRFHIRYYYDESQGKYVDISLDEAHFAKFWFSPKLLDDIKALLQGAADLAGEHTGGFTDTINQLRAFSVQINRQAQDIFQDDEALLYIPAGRNLLATIPDLIMPDSGIRQSPTDSVDITQMDLITQEFLQYIKRMRSRFGSRLEDITKTYVKTVSAEIRYHDIEIACDLIRSILKAEYVYDQDGEKLYYAKDKWVKLMFSSSGQQEVLWALNCIFLAILQQEKTYLIFEEPEAHIFPDAQEALTRLIALLINSNRSNVMLTTHSPYILTAINLLIFSGIVEKNSISGIIPKECRLKKGSVAAYMISMGNGVFKSIVDTKRGLIDALEIDHISDSINARMETLLIQQIKKQREGAAE